MPKRIAAVVENSVDHDARVLKQADSLAAAGFEVTIIGIPDRRSADPETRRPSGVVIRRCAWKDEAHRLTARLYGAAGLLAVVLVGGVAFAGLDGLRAVLRAPVTAIVLAALVAAAAAFPFLVRVRRHLRLARAAGRAAAAPPPPPVAPAPTSAPAPAPPRPPGRASRWLRRPRTALLRTARRRAMARALADVAPDAVHCHDLETVPVGWSYAHRRRCALVFDSHELPENRSLLSPSRRLVCRLMMRYYAGRVDAFVTINRSIAECLRTRYPRLPEPVIVMNACRRPDRAVRDDGRLHRAAGLDPSARILLFQGGFARFRGLEALVRSGPLLPDGWALVMMGWGALEAHLREAAAAVDPDGARVRFVPAAPQAELPAWTAGATLGVIPYENVCLNHWFCTPNKLWEYPVAGVPVLASPFPELRRTIEAHGIGRLLDDPVTPANIAETVASIDDDELARLRASCARFLEEEHWGIFEDRLVRLYRGLLGDAAADAGTAPRRPVVVAGDA